MLTHVLPHESPKPDTKSGDLSIPGGICSHRGQKRLASRNQLRRYFQSSVSVQGLEGAPASDALGLSVKGCCLPECTSNRRVVWLLNQHDVRFSEGASATARVELEQRLDGRCVADRVQLPNRRFGLAPRPYPRLELNLAFAQTSEPDLELEGLASLKRQRHADPSVSFAALQPR